MSGKEKLKKVSDHESNQFWRTIAIGAIVVIVFLSLPHLCSADCGHSHDHHHDEPASFKWTKQANEGYEDHHHHHEHSHGHGYGHDHGHGHHSHGVHKKNAPKNAQSKLKENCCQLNSCN